MLWLSPYVGRGLPPRPPHPLCEIIECLCAPLCEIMKIHPQNFLHQTNSLCYNVFALLDCVMVALRTLNPSV